MRLKNIVLQIGIVILIVGCTPGVEEPPIMEVNDVVEEVAEVNLIEETITEAAEVVDLEFDVKNMLIINADVLNVRSNYDIDSEVISKVYQNQLFDVYDTKEDLDGESWYKINSDGPEEWVAGWSCKLVNINDIVGVFEYIYPNNTDRQNENHTIVFEIIDDTLAGRYYGTSDDFDDAREGYYPGFYVTKILDLRFEGNILKFKLNPESEDMFTERLTIDIVNTDQAITKGYINWQPGISIDDRTYEGRINGKVIIIDGPFGEREFKAVPIQVH